jgi:hypothetical protein
MKYHRKWEVRGWLSGNARSVATNRMLAVNLKNVQIAVNRDPLPKKRAKRIKKDK